MGEDRGVIERIDRTIWVGRALVPCRGACEGVIELLAPVLIEGILFDPGLFATEMLTTWSDKVWMGTV